MESLATLAADPTAWVALITLIVMEVVLGIDNLIFISILSNKLPAESRSRARRVGIAAALVLRLGLLSMVAFIVQLTEPVVTLFDHGFSWRDLILIAGGLFLVWKATKEIHHSVDPDPEPTVFAPGAATVTFAGTVGQILALDLVFSIDSIITAVGMTPHVPIMVIAVIVAVAVMLLAADPLSNFIHANPTVVMLALGFLLLIGTTLIAEGFAALVEGLNMMARRARQRKAGKAGT